MTNLESIIGDPKQIDEELSQFRETTKMLSSQSPRMIEEYPHQWVALYGDEVKANGSTLRVVLNAIDEQGLPKGQVIVRFIEKNHRTMIL